MRVLFVVLTLALGCSEPSSAADEDAGAIPAPRVDAQLIVRPDAGPPGDAGRPGDDAARPGDDAALPLDAARPGDDAARPGDDAARPGDDADLPLDAERPGDAARPGDDAALPLDAARPSDVGVSPDAGDDPCEGLTLCAEPAWSCEGDVAVACWYDDNDCLVATRTDCTLQLNGYCSTEGVLPGCREGEGICGGMGFCPAERYCEGDTLHVCISDEEGCASTRVEQTCANEGKICVATQDGGADCVLASPEAVSAQIAAARAAIDGAARLPRAGDWDIEHALVTRVKAPLGADAGGFILQGERTGPAIFVLHEDPVGVVEVGDEVSVWFEEVDLDQGRRVASGLGWIDIWSQGNDVNGWAQEVSGVDLVTALDDYEFELITLEAQVIAPFASAGPRFVDATLRSAGVTEGDLRLRVPTTLSTSLLGDRADLVGCIVRIGPSPLWRYLDRAQPTAMDISEIAVECP